ncbi:MAG: HAD family hydrolase [Thermocladium sp.]
MRIKAVLFDFDDTLMDVNDGRRGAIEAVAAAIRSIHGVPIGEAIALLEIIEREMERRAIFDRRKWFLSLYDRLGLSLEKGEALNLLRIYWGTWAKLSKAYPDTEPALQMLKPRVSLGIIANTDGVNGFKRARMEMSGILHYFDLIVVAGDDTPEVKPHPAPFLLAASLLHVDPEECLFVGDRVGSDIRGAMTAGMETALIRSREESPLPSIKLNSLMDIDTYLS